MSDPRTRSLLCCTQLIRGHYTLTLQMGHSLKTYFASDLFKSVHSANLFTLENTVPDEFWKNARIWIWNLVLNFRQPIILIVLPPKLSLLKILLTKKKIKSWIKVQLLTKNDLILQALKGLKQTLLEKLTIYI